MMQRYVLNGAKGKGKSARQHMEQCSYGQTTIKGTAIAVDIPDSGKDSGGNTYNSLTACGSTEWYVWQSTAFNQAVSQLGASAAQAFTHRVLILPDGNKCTWGGLGDVGCSLDRDPVHGRSECKVWIASGGYPNSVVLHELGHNNGLAHASTSSDEYGDNTCIMGGGAVCFNTPHAWQLGFIDVTSYGVQEFPAGKSLGLLVPSSSGNTAPKQLGGYRIQISQWSSSFDLWLGYRTNVGFDTDLGQNLKGKLHVYSCDATGIIDYTHSLLVASLSSGESYTDSAAGVTILAGGTSQGGILATVCRLANAGGACTLVQPDVCTNLKCGVHGYCTSGSSGVSCVCRNNYTGASCQVPPAPSAEPVSSSLLAHYPLLENQGSAATADFSGKGATATFAVGTSAYENSALSFTGQSLKTPVASASIRTLSAWVYPRSITSGRVIDSDVPNQYGTGFGFNGGIIEVILDNMFWNTRVAPTLNKWQHILVAFNSASASLYVNGALVASTAYAQGSVTQANYIIGTSNANSGNTFNGLLREVRIYNKVLTQAEVTSVYQTDAPIALSEVVAGALLVHYPLVQSQGNTVFDESGNTAPTSGIVGSLVYSNSALSLSGQSFQTPVPNGATRTLSAWVFPRSITSGRVIDTDVPNQYGTGFGFSGGFIQGILDDQFWNTGVAPAVNKWQHILLTFNKSSASLYVNGALAASLSYTQAASVTQANYVIGTSNANPTNTYDGLLREVRIYDRVLTTSEITSVYKANAPVSVRLR